MTENSFDTPTTLSFEELFPPVADELTFTVSAPVADFRVSRLAQAVEDCDARLVNMNITDLGGPSAPVVAEIRVDGQSRERIVRALLGYGYYVDGEIDDNAEIGTFRDRVNELLLYLDIK